jgi:hypothetical protein
LVVEVGIVGHMELPIGGEQSGESIEADTAGRDSGDAAMDGSAQDEIERLERHDSVSGHVVNHPLAVALDV